MREAVARRRSGRQGSKGQWVARLQATKEEGATRWLGLVMEVVAQMVKPP